MRRLSIAIILMLLTSVAAAAPRVKTITLDKHTTLTVEIVPNLGTRFIFPFVLDESDEYVPFTLSITNPAFESKREPGRNSFVVRISPQAGQNQYGNLFVTVAGYQITVELRTTNDPSRHYSDVAFKLSNAVREELIQKGIAQRTKALEVEYKKKFDDIDRLADQKAVARIGVLALKSPSKSRIKEEAKLTLTNGDVLTLFVDEALTYGPYTIFTFEIGTDSNSQAVSILDAKLFATNTETNMVRPIDAANDIPPRIPPGAPTRGVLTATDATLNPKELLKLQILTDKGTVEAQW